MIRDLGGPLDGVARAQQVPERISDVVRLVVGIGSLGKGFLQASPCRLSHLQDDIAQRHAGG